MTEPRGWIYTTSRDMTVPVQKLVGGPGFEPGASRSRITRQFIQTCRFLRLSVRFFKSTRPVRLDLHESSPDYYMKYYRVQVVQTGSSVIKPCDRPGIGRRQQRECHAHGSARLSPQLP